MCYKILQKIKIFAVIDPGGGSAATEPVGESWSSKNEQENEYIEWTTNGH